MCAFAGYCNLNHTDFSVEKNLLDAMQQELAHRGPDDFGVWISANQQVGLAHRRLSIIDLSAQGHQPMVDQERGIAVSFNGEIYNHIELKNLLIRYGYTFKSHVDTEVLLYAYDQWGIDFIHKLDGMFAFSLVDSIRNEVYLIRDRIGVKPAYFAVQNGIFSFASEIKALWKLPWNHKEISKQALYHYLTFMVAPAPYTMYKNVYKLPAGFYAKISAKKELSFCEWYSPLNTAFYDETHLIENEAYCVDKIDQLLVDSTKKRMIADVPVGAFLSGGIDSSLNVALMSQFATNINTFTVSFDDMPTQDIQAAQQVSQLFSTQHHNLTINEKDAFEFYEKMIYMLDEPLADCVCIPFYFVSLLAYNAGIKVVQVGEGADELFYGYPTYARYKKMYDNFLRPLKRILPGIARKKTQQLATWLFSRRPDYAQIIDNWSQDRPIIWGGAIAFGELQKQKVLMESFIQEGAVDDDIIAKIYKELKQDFDSFSVIKNHLSSLKKYKKKDSFFSSLLYLELKQRLPELLLMRADKMSMATSLEARVPFLDYKLVEFMLRVSPELNCKNNENKYLLKKVALRYLPDNIVYRKKVGFAAPTQRWYKHGNYFPGLFKLYVEKRKSNDFHDCSRDLSKSFDLNPNLIAVQKWTLQNLWGLK